MEIGRFIFAERPRLEEKDIETLFCEETCEFTDDLSTITTSSRPSEAWMTFPRFMRKSGADRPECDAVCELFGGPLTRWERFQLWVKEYIYFPIHHKIYHGPFWFQFKVQPVYARTYVINNEYPVIGKEIGVFGKLLGKKFYKSFEIIYGQQ